MSSSNELSEYLIFWLINEKWKRSQRMQTEQQSVRCESKGDY